MKVLLFVIAALFPAVLAYYGVDVSSRVGTSTWSCLKSNGYSFAIVRVYQSNGVVDPNGAATINDAWSGGMSHVDGYIFPCYSCGNPAGQIDAAINNLNAHGVKSIPRDESIQTLTARNESSAHLGAHYGMLWIDVEGTQYWSSSATNNVNFIVAMANEGVKRGISIGIYTSSSQWNPIAGGSTALSKYPLWYPHYDNNPSYSDWVSFGGWGKPSIKQYVGNANVCSAGIDKNFY